MALMRRKYSCFCIVERFLGARDGGRADHIDEAVGMVVDEADALLAGLWGDEHDDAQVVLVGNGLHDVQIVIEGQVGDDHSADASLGTRLAERLDAVVQDGVQIAHQDKWNLHLILDGLQLGEECLQVHAVLQGLGGSTLDDGTVGQRVAEGDAHLNHGDAPTLHGQDHVGGAFEGRTASTEIERKEFLSLRLAEK